ncbi:MAG TPA: hypothetical protein VG028_05435 [Terriglobia bacterium]|nr:hypothetical protein [Terriglobia bacterium]
MNHLSEEQLILFHYQEADEAHDLNLMEQHLAGCEVCRSRLDDLERELALFGEAPVPARPPDYGEQVWLRLRPRLMERPGSIWSGFFAPRQWVVAGGLAALIVGAFLAGRYWQIRQAPEPAPISAQARERILLLAVGNHLERSQMILVELVNADGKGPVDIAPERRTARDLVEANRLYRQTAARDGDLGMASVLDDLERVLIEVANSPSEISSAQLDSIRHRIEAKGILFKIRVVGTQVEEREKSAQTLPPSGKT